MAEKQETRFRARLRAKLDEIPYAWFESIQQVGITGTPDILGCVGPYFVALEIKVEHGVSSALQRYKIDKIKGTGSYATIVTPGNMRDVLKHLESLSKSWSDTVIGEKK